MPLLTAVVLVEPPGTEEGGSCPERLLGVDEGRFSIFTFGSGGLYCVLGWSEMTSTSMGLTKMLESDSAVCMLFELFLGAYLAELLDPLYNG